MKNILKIVSGIAFFALVQILFYLIVPTTSKNFDYCYIFLTVFMVLHIMILFALNYKVGAPASFAPVTIGNIIATIESVATILLCIFVNSLTCIVLVTVMIALIYVIAVSVYSAMSLQETEHDLIVISQNTIDKYYSDFESNKVTDVSAIDE